MNIQLAGENALIIYFSDTASPHVLSQVQQTRTAIINANYDWLTDLIPSYASLLVQFNMDKVDYLKVKKALAFHVANVQAQTPESSSTSLIHLPAYYDESVGVDLSRIAKLNHVSIEEVISIHQKTEYLVYAIGFAPGFAYLGEVDEKIATPRLSTPRAKVPAGAIAIADKQTAVYPSQSPGGWNIIGLCPTVLFNPTSSPTMPFQVGDRIKFNAISKSEFLALGGKIPTDMPNSSVNQ